MMPIMWSQPEVKYNGDISKKKNKWIEFLQTQFATLCRSQ